MTGRIVALLAAGLLAPLGAFGAAVLSNVPETEGYSLVYSLPIPNSSPGWNTTPVAYTVNNAASIPDNSFSRIGFYLEVQPTGGGPLQFVYASVNAAGFSQSASKLGVPTTGSGAFFQQSLASMNVVSNVPGIVTGTGFATGNIEFWPSDYYQTNSALVPNASPSVYDFGDDGASTAAGYGSMQIHNHDLDGTGPGTNGQTLFAYNAWGSAGTSDLGIGNQPGGHPDWTFNKTNIASYSVKHLQVVVGGPALPPPPPPLPAGPKFMPLGDSITDGAGAAGGYRTKLFASLSSADPGQKPDFVGSATTNASSPLITAGETNHEGHGGYRIDQIANNLAGNDGAGGNNGGFWLTGTGGRPALLPDFILLHIGTNDILQNFNTGSMAMRLDNLVGQIVAARPDAHLLLSNIIPINNANNALVLAYNEQIENVIVPKYEALGRDITFIDQYSNFVNGDGSIRAELLPDAVHPNQTGYNLMADTWFAAIQTVPEPSAMLLAAFGFAALSARRPRALVAR